MKKVFKKLYVWVLIGILIGCIIGFTAPEVGAQLKPLSDAFIGLIKMLISPIIFCTVVLGIAGASDLRQLGRVGGKAFLYFEIVTSFALALGLLVANIIKPGVGMNIDPSTLDAQTVAVYFSEASKMTVTDHLLHIIPKTFVDAFTGGGDLLQVLLIAVLFGVASAKVGQVARPIVDLVEKFSKILFSMMSMLMYLAPIGAGAAMAFTVGKFGWIALKQQLFFVLLFYSTCIVFVVVILGAIAYFYGKFSIFKFLKYIKEELLTVLGTSSSETALVPIMEKLEKLGCPKSIVGIVVPSGYSFNLDGTAIYMTLAGLFIAQALNIDLTMGQQLMMLLVAMLTSKGASGVTGSGFIILAATLAVIPAIPTAGLYIVLGVDRFMSESRALTNIIGNAVATIVVSKSEKQLNTDALHKELNS